MPNDLTNPLGVGALEPFDFDADGADFGYDPLADTDEDDEGADDSAFTSTPAPLDKVPDGEAAAGTAPAPERIAALFEKFNPRRRVLAGVLRFLDEPRTADELDAEVARLQEHDFSVYTGANYAALLEEAGAVVKTDAAGVPLGEAPDQPPEIVEVNGARFYKPAPLLTVYLRATEDARAFLAQDDPLARFKDLIASDAKYLSIYLRILDAAAQEGGAVTADLNAVVDDDPLVQSPRLYTAHFTELLERCGALRWDGTWKTTEVGSALLDGSVACPEGEE